jgi:large repetitive protein
MTSFRLLTCIAGCALAVSQASANLIVNGSFEQPTQFSPGGWALYSSIPGWTSVGQYPIEIGSGATYGVTGYDQKNVMEMDSTGNAMVQQVLGAAGGSYQLSFLYAQRVGVSPASGSFDVYWNNSLVGSFAPNSTAMTLYSTTVSGTAMNTLEFVGTGIQDSYGALVDNVSLEVVPEPTTMIAGALLLLPFGASAIRILRNRKQAA